MPAAQWQICFLWPSLAGKINNLQAACLSVFEAGRRIRFNCGISEQPLHADNPSDWIDHHAAIVVIPCGHMQHMTCQMAWNGFRPNHVHVCAHCHPPDWTYAMLTWFCYFFQIEEATALYTCRVDQYTTNMFG